MNNYIQFLNDTLRICQQRTYSTGKREVVLPLTEQQIRSVRVFLPEELKKIEKLVRPKPDCGKPLCRFSCENTDSFTMALKRKKESGTTPLVLNFANGIYPGGGVRMGATAQEEDLCRCSSLLLSLESSQASEYYQYNRSLQSCMGSDAMIWTRDVVVVKNSQGQLLDEPQLVSVLSCSAPYVSKGMDGLTRSQYELLMGDRISRILICAYHLGYRDLVLGAFGCGAFGNDPHLVARLFYQKLKRMDADGMRFDHIDFAVKVRTENDPNFIEFNAYFKEGQFYKIMNRNAQVLFWQEAEDNGCFSNWYFSPFVIDDYIYLHVEQYMMAQKAKMFHDSQRYTAILRSDTPQQCKQLGRKVSPYDDVLWSSKRKEVLKTGLMAKFTQNEDLKKLLLNTEDALLAEASPFDPVFGIGLSAAEAVQRLPQSWPGENLLGKTLMEIRDELSKR